jgi:mRNA-degrading endonuclease RelE of RelBE toxin-antitoxin system
MTAAAAMQLPGCSAAPRTPGAAKLQGHDAYRIRIGDHRVLCIVDDARRRVESLQLAHRREVYR